MAHVRIDANPFSLREAVLSAMTPSEIHWIAGDRDECPPKPAGSTPSVSEFVAFVFDSPYA
jgi:hypothetical protein